MSEDANTPPPKRTVGRDGKSYPAKRKPKPAAAPEHATDGSSRPANATGKRDTRFKPGNPGKPKGTRHRATLMAEALIDGSGELLVKKCVEMALGGDAAAMRLVMERLCPPPPRAACEPLHAEDKRGLRLDRRGVGTHRGGCRWRDHSR